MSSNSKVSTYEHEITSISELLTFLESYDDQDLILFRGQSADWPLRPKIARDSSVPREDIIKIENNVFHTFRRRALPHLLAVPETAWDWLALAQHHGLPTRLLDWSGNPLAALWFAVQKPSSDLKPAVVWAYKPTESDELNDFQGNPFAVQRSLLFRPNHITRRIVAQGGHFTIHAHLPDHGGFIPFEKDPLRGGELTKFVIPSTAFSNLRWYLDRCGIESATMFPDLDGLASYIEWCHYILPDEPKS